jgi:hypothetical protein
MFNLNSNSEIVYIPERRVKPRFICKCPTRIRGHDNNGQLFEEEGTAINLSRSGVYVILNREIPIGMELSLRIAFPTGLLKLGTSKLAVRGVVVRGEVHSETTYGIAVKFQEYRFL